MHLGLGALGFPFGRGDLVSGATGNFGSAGVAVALTMGAAVVICPGRNQKVLDDLKTPFGERF